MNNRNIKSKPVTFEKAKAKATKALEYLKTCDKYSTYKAYEAIWDLDGGIPDDDYDTRIELGLYLAKQGVVPLIVKIMTSLEKYNGKKKKDKYENLILVLMICTNLIAHTKLAYLKLDFVKHGAIELLLSMLQASKQVDSKRELRRTIQILKMLRHCVTHPDRIVRETYRNSNAVSVLMKYLNSTEIMVKIKSLAILAYIVNEKDESDVIASTKDCIAHLVDMLKQAVKTDGGNIEHSTGGRSYTIRLYELIDTTNRLAVNDANKMEIVMHGGVPIITEIITKQKHRKETMQYAVETLGKLAFVDAHAEKIAKRLQATNTVEVLKKLQESENPALREDSTGLLWKLDLIDAPNPGHGDGTQPRPQTPPPPYAETVAAQVNVFISYSWRSNQERVKKLKDRLQEAGFSVWMDIDKMTGNMLRSMADAVETAAIVLVCASSSYKDSPYCEQEANYAFQKQKPIIPIIMDDNCQDGWLGILIAGKLHFKVHTDEMVESQISAIITEIKKLAEPGKSQGKRIRNQEY